VYYCDYTTARHFLHLRFLASLQTMIYRFPNDQPNRLDNLKQLEGGLPNAEAARARVSTASPQFRMVE
jgi:hypothetical protein